MRAFTVRVDGDQVEDRALLVLGTRADGQLLISDPGQDARLRWVPAEACRLSALHLDQDEREWWRGFAAPTEHGH
ncbi:MAG: hypothetical protein ACM3S1_14050 [Hyphomicrobiales bacterium]